MIILIIIEVGNALFCVGNFWRCADLLNRMDGKETFAAVMLKSGAAELSAIHHNYLNALRERNAEDFPNEFAFLCSMLKDRHFNSPN